MVWSKGEFDSCPVLLSDKMSSGEVTTPVTPMTPQAAESVITHSAPASSSSVILSSNTPRHHPVSKADERNLSRLTLGSSAEHYLEKNFGSEHQKRLTLLRNEAKRLEATNWQYESIEKLLGR